MEICESNMLKNMIILLDFIIVPRVKKAQEWAAGCGDEDV